MATQDFPVLKLTADFGGDLGTKTGKFCFKKATVSFRTQVDPLLDGAFDRAAGAGAEGIDIVTGGATAARRGVTVDVGGGQQLIEIDAEVRVGEDGQWGYSADPDTLNLATATGGDRIQKAEVLSNYIRFGIYDSKQPARLRYGEVAPGGAARRDSLPVTIRNPDALIPRDQASAFDQSIVLATVLHQDINIPDVGDLFDDLQDAVDDGVGYVFDALNQVF